MSKRAEIRTVITDLVKDYIKQFGVPHQPKELAGAYWDIRQDDEIDRDTAADVIQLDYELWVICAVADFKTDGILEQFKFYTTKNKKNDH
jgi:hypothetical protein